MNLLRKNKNMVLVTLAIVCVCLAFYVFGRQNDKAEYSTIFALDTVINQTVYGKNAQSAIQAVQSEVTDFENTMSMFQASSEINTLNQNAGKTPTKLSDDVFDMLKRSKELSQQSENAFALTIAPVTKLWDITGDNPTIPQETAIEQSLTLVDDSSLVLDATNSTAFLPVEGQGVDLGGIAKGELCNIIADIYNEYNVESAIISLGGNVYAHGVKPDGTLFNVGFRDPNSDSYIASVEIEDKVFAVSGGYERNFVADDGKTYHHIIDPKTGYPVQTDIATVGVIADSGEVADFYSTTLFVWGKDKTIEYMQKEENQVIMLDKQDNLYVSKSLQDTFKLNDGQDYNVIFI